MSEITTGVRAAGTFAPSFDYDVEMHKQSGSLRPKSIDAWAGHWNVGYTFKDARSKPRAFGEYNYASGNKNPNGNVWGTHDQIYPPLTTRWTSPINSAGKTLRTYGQASPQKLGKKWTLTQIFNDLWVTTKNDAVYGDNGAVVITAKPNATSRHLGTELDLIAEYQENRHVSYGFGFAHLFTGQFLKEATPGKDYNYPFA